MRKAIFSAVLLASTVIAGANAATIRYEGTNSGMNLVSINGEIESGDAERFKQLTAALTGRTVVILNSPGGRLADGLAIGADIHQSHFDTVVDAHKMCASVCGLIWLAGASRVLTTGSEIGFHAAYEPDGSESGAGNAIVGAYLTDLGFSIPAIVYMTQSAPHEMTWLHPNDARQYGITFILMAPPPQEDSQAFMPSPPPPSVPVSPPATVAMAPPWSPPVAVARIGPSFDCARADTEVTKFICSDAELSLVDLLLIQPYYVLRQEVGPLGWKPLMVEAIAFQAAAQQACGIDPAGNLPADLPAVKACLIRAYSAQRNQWMARLSGAGLQEAMRPIQQHIALQGALRSLGYLPATAQPDGIYGTVTRSAIMNWQASVALPVTGLLGDADAARLTQGVVAAANR